MMAVPCRPDYLLSEEPKVGPGNAIPIHLDAVLVLGGRRTAVRLPPSKTHVSSVGIVRILY